MGVVRLLLLIAADDVDGMYRKKNAMCCVYFNQSSLMPLSPLVSCVAISAFHGSRSTTSDTRHGVPAMASNLFLCRATLL